MGSNGVVSIRVEALGVSITIADGSIAIEQTSTRNPAAGVSPATTARPTSARQIPPIQAVAEHTPPLAEDNDTAVTRSSRDSGTTAPAAVRATSETPVIDELEQTSSRPPSRNGPGGPPSDSGQETQTKPLWSDEEVEKLKALYPTHSASAIATQLGRGRNAVRSKAQNLCLRKDGPPTVTSKPAKPAPKPRSLSAAVTELFEPAPPPPVLESQDAVPVSIFEHRSGCRWIVSEAGADVVMYCGAPVVDSSSWCGQHCRRVFRTVDNERPRA